MDLTTLLFPALILVLFIPIFLSGRRQRRQQAEMAALQAALEPGDIVVTTSGLRATVVDASYEDTIDLEISDGVITTWVRAAVREKVPAVADRDEDATPDAESEGEQADPPAGSTPAGTAADSVTAGSTAAVSTSSELPGTPLSLEKDDSANGSSRN